MMNRKSIRYGAAPAVRLASAIALATVVGTSVALADGHTPYWQHSAYDRHPQAHGRVYHHPAPPPRHHNDWHEYRYRDPYYSYAPPPVYYDPYPSPGVSLFFSF
jgi:hypothetical protein